MIKVKKVKDFRFKFTIVVVCYLISFALMMPVYYIESSLPGGDIKTVQQALWFGFASLTTIGFGDITVHHPLSQILVVLSFLLTRGAVLVVIAMATLKVAGRRAQEHLSVEDRLLGIENELKNFRSVIMDYQRERNAELKRSREKRTKSGTISVNSIDSLRDLVGNPVTARMALVCDFLLDDIYCENVDLWSSLKQEASDNGVFSISFNGGVCVVL